MFSIVKYFFLIFTSGGLFLHEISLESCIGLVGLELSCDIGRLLSRDIVRISKQFLVFSVIRTRKVDTMVTPVVVVIGHIHK